MILKMLQRAASLTVAVSLFSCAEGGASVSVKYAPEFVPGPTTVSILGVYRSGRMSPEAWTAMGPALSAALGQKRCPVGFSDKLRRVNPDQYAAIDELTKSDGITDELLSEVAPQAVGETVVVINVHGRITEAKGDQAEPAARSVSGRRSRGPGRGHAPVSSYAPSPGLAISASLYSVKLRRSVAKLQTSYGGTELEEGLARFAKEFAKVMPGSTCLGWRFAGPAADEGTGTPLE